MPALKYVRGEFLEFMRDILESSACRQRGIFERSYIDKLLAAPDQYFTKLQGSKLWHMALLELWFQLNVDDNSWLKCYGTEKGIEIRGERPYILYNP